MEQSSKIPKVDIENIPLGPPKIYIDGVYMEEFKISEHVLVPKHEILSEKEEKKLLKELNISKKQLPRIFISDPLVEEIKAKVGNIIKITRKSLVSGENIYYRVVIKD